MAIASPGHGEPLSLGWTIEASDFTDHSILVSLSARDVANAKTFELVLGDRGLTNYFRFPLHSRQGQQWIPNDELVAVTIPWSGYSVVGTPDRAAITDVAIRIVDDGAPVQIAVDGIALVPEPIARYPRGVASFTFDDNHASMIDVAAPLLDAYGVPATAYVIVEYVDMPDHTSLAALHERHARGWDIAAHSYSVAAHETRFPLMPPVDLERDIVASRAWIIEQGFTGADHCAYPGGEMTSDPTDVFALTRRYFTSCRSIYQRQRESFPPADAHKLRVLYITNGTTLAAAKRAVDDAVAAREWIILVFHRLVAGTPERSTEWRTADFRALVEHVMGSGIAVETVTRVLESEN